MDEESSREPASAERGPGEGQAPASPRQDEAAREPAPPPESQAADEQSDVTDSLPPLLLIVPLVVLIVLVVNTVLARQEAAQTSVRTAAPPTATVAGPRITPTPAPAAPLPPTASTTTGPTAAPTSTAVALASAATRAPAAGPSPLPTRAPTSVPSVPTPAPTATISPNAPLVVAATFTLGQALCDLAVDGAGRRLYVTDDGPERLLVLDAQTGRQTGQFDLRDSLCSVALDEQGDTVYAPTWRRAGAGKYDSSRVQAVELGSGTVRSFPDDQFPSGPFFDTASRKLYVGDTAQPRLWTLDAPTGAPSALPVGVHVNRVAVSPKNRRLYLASPQDDRVVVADPGAGTVLASLRVGQRPWGVAADPVSGAILVSSELSGGVSLIDPATDRVVRTTPTGGHPRNVAADGQRGRFYVLNAADRTVSAVAADGTLLSTSAPLPGSEEPTGLAVAPQAGRVFVVTKTHVYALQ